MVVFTIELFVNETKPAASKPFPVNSQADSSKMAIVQERDATNHPGHESFDGELARFFMRERHLSKDELEKTLSFLKESYGISESGKESEQKPVVKEQTLPRDTTAVMRIGLESHKRNLRLSHAIRVV